MKTKELIKQLQELDPTGELDIMVNTDRHDYPVYMGHPNIAYVKDDEWWYEGMEGTADETIISVTADS